MNSLFSNERLDDYMGFLKSMIQGYKENCGSYESKEEYINYMHIVVKEFNKRYQEFKDEVIEEIVVWKMQKEQAEKEDATEDN